MILLHGRRNSSNVQRVIWALEELGLSYERRNVGGSFGGGDTAEYRALNPTGLVPTLQDGALTIWESEAALRYLAASYGAGSLWPEAAADRARGDQWLAFAASTLAPAFGAVFYRTVRAPRAAQDPAALAPFAQALNEAFAVVDAGLGGREGYIGGSGFSYADIPFGIFAYRYFAIDIERPEVPNLAAWYERLMTRPAFARHVMLPMGSCAEEWLEHEKSLA